MRWPPVWSADGSVLACHLASRTRPKECVAVDGLRGDDFDRVGPPALSRDGKHLAYRAQKGERSFLVLDGRRGSEFDYMSDPALSADGSVVAVAARHEGRWQLVVGERRAALDGPPSSVFLSADGRSVGWVMQEGSDGSSQVRVVVNGKAGEAFRLVGRAVFSPDGRRVAYAADDGDKQYVVIGERKIEVSGRLGDPVFSPDGTKVGYGAQFGRELWWKVLELP